ncbi:hypothetical protein [Erysipelothrix anatis]|uniref:hypothetical protein n=1 Tax=Erysipelothrix anatis TaxID=2683713 RepID=UPI00135A4F71|nr:hypothetical protein [Erysipelothrix anatis]
MGKILNSKGRVEFSFNAFKKWVINYKLFNILMVIALVLVGYTLWEERPNSMRTPFYTNTRNYNEVTGSYDFDEFYELLSQAKGASIKDVHFKLETPYCYDTNDVSLCVKGYELFQTDSSVNLTSVYKYNKASYFVILRMEVANNRDNPITVGEFRQSYGDVSDFTKPLSNEEFEIPNNIGSFGRDMQFTVNPHETYDGYLFYPLTSEAFRQLYFDGSYWIEMPDILDTSKFDDRNLMGISRVIDLPVVEPVMASYLETVNNLPTDQTIRNTGFSKVSTHYEPQVTMTNTQETLAVTVETIEEGYTEYRPYYIHERKNRSYLLSKTNYQAVKVRMTNLGMPSINTQVLNASLDLTSSNYKSTGYLVTPRLQVDTNGYADLIFEFSRDERGTNALVPNETYRFILSNDRKEILLEGEFKLEQ